MVNLVTLFRSFLQTLLKLVGVEPRKVEIEPGTVINFWVAAKPKTRDNIQKPSVVFVHGFGADGILTWIFQVLGLRGRYSIYVPDLLFFGCSTTASSERSPEFQAQCLAAGLRKLGVKRCVVVGLSYGGGVGFKMGELYPDLVEALVICGFMDALTESLSNARLKAMGVRRWSDLLLPTTAEGLRRMFTFGTHWLPPWIPNRIFQDFLEDTTMFSHRKEREELLEAFVTRDDNFTPYHYLQMIYLLWGIGDKILGMELAHELKERLGKNASLHYVDNAGHLLQLERPLAYNARLKQILTSLQSI